MFDLDAWEERAAIMEFCGGMSRFRAETAAAAAQGVTRHEAIRFRNSQQARNQREATARNAENDMPGVQRREAKENGSVPVCHVLGGWCGLVLLALWMVGGRLV